MKKITLDLVESHLSHSQVSLSVIQTFFNAFAINRVALLRILQ